MKAVVYEDIQKVRVDDIDEPSIEEPTDAIVRVSSSAICGSDLHFYNGKAPMAPGEQLGHEGVGTVESVGTEVRSFAEGDRVVIAFNLVCGECWFCKKGQNTLCENWRNLGAGMVADSPGGTQAELVRIPIADVNLLKIPEGMDDDRAVFVGDILTTAYYGAAISDIKPGDTSFPPRHSPCHRSSQAHTVSGTPLSGSASITYVTSPSQVAAASR